MNKLQFQDSMKEINDSLNSLKDDESMPRNIKAKIEIIIGTLNEDVDVSVKVGKSLQILDEISEDTNIQGFIRPHLWDLTSKLEKLNQ